MATSGDRSLVAPARAALEQAIAEDDWLRRDLSAQILAGLDGAAATPLLLRAFTQASRSGDDDSLLSSLRQVMRADPEAARPAILEAVASAETDLRGAGLVALGHVLRPGDAGIVGDALADPDPWIRRATLSGLPDNTGTLELVIGMLPDPDMWIRREAVLRLGWSGRPEVVNHLVALVDDPADPVRSALGQAIGRLAAMRNDRGGEAIGRPAPDGVDRSGAVRALLRLSADTHAPARASAVIGLGGLGGELDTLRALATDPDDRVRAAVAGTLGAYAFADAIDVRQMLAADPVGEVRWRIAHALLANPAPEARPLLTTLSTDADPLVRETAVEALASI
jgi:HEAT repeat protein